MKRIIFVVVLSMFFIGVTFLGGKLGVDILFALNSVQFSTVVYKYIVFGIGGFITFIGWRLTKHVNPGWTQDLAELMSQGIKTTVAAFFSSFGGVKTTVGFFLVGFGSLPTYLLLTSFIRDIVFRR